MNQLLGKKLNLAQRLIKTKKNLIKKDIWEKILLIQKEIQAQAITLYSEAHKPLWNTLSKIDSDTDAQDFWKTIKKFRKQETDNVFPNIITDGTKSFTTKSSIKQAITKYFKDVSLNKDHEANTFINKFYVQHETEPPIDTKNHQPPEVIDMEELTKSIQHQQNLKKGGPDGTTNECFKYLPEHMLIKLLSILNACIKLTCTPYSWQKSLTMLIYKKETLLR